MGALLLRLLQVLKQIWAPLGAWIAARGMAIGASVAVRVAVLTAYGVFLGVFFTGMSGMAIQSVYNANPFGGVPGDMMYLLCSCFPVHFALGLFQAYIAFKFTVMQAAIALSRTMKFFFGV